MKSNTDIALLLLRAGLAIVFIAHGWEKVSDMSTTLGSVAHIGLPAFWAYIIAYVEFVGGLSMLIGMGTGWTGIALALTTIIGAIATVRFSDAPLGNHEFSLMLFLSALAVSLAGSGRYTLKYLFRKE